MNLETIITQCLTASALSQASIAVFGVTAVALSQSLSPAARKWASVFGLVGQPFWFYSAAVSQATKTAPPSEKARKDVITESVGA